MKKWKIIGAVILVVLLLIAGIGTYYISRNTNFFGLNLNKEEIKNNNESTSSEDYEVLYPKILTVAEKYKAGVFAQERKINLPRDFKINVFAAGLGKPRGMTQDNNGDLYATDISGRVLYFKDTNSDDVADEISTIDSNLRSPHGILFYKNNLYVAEEDKVNVYKDINGKNFSTKQTIITGLPSDGGHRTRSLAIGPDEKLYVSIGSLCNVCEEKDKRRAAVIRSNLDGSNQEIYAEGLRNSVGIVFRGSELWSVDNGRDLIGDNLPPEEVNIIEQGKNYGWPYCYGKGVANPEYPNRKEYCEKQTAFPKYEIQAHSAPLGLAFFTDNFPEPLNSEDNLLVALHGSWNRSTPTGYKLVRIKTSSDENEIINFATGWLEDNGNSWGRPVDVSFKKDGKIFVTDDKAGAIYLIQYEQGCDAKTACVVN